LIQLYDKSSATSLNIGSLLTRRYNLIMKAQKANIFGIIVVNSNVVNYSDEIRNLKALLDNHEKKHYTFSMNKLNEAKIKNFPEIDVYVVISCPKSCFYEYSEFYKVVILPYELRVAFGEIQWDGNILMDSVYKEYTKEELKPEDGLEAKLEN
jgi:diphthamide biosynthesis protein 2